MIKKAGIIGLGALGGMYGEFLAKAMGRENVYILGDKERLCRYRKDGVFVNGSKIDFNYDIKDEKVDLLIVAKKFHHLKNALENVKSFISESTIIISLLNGVSSEEVIRNTLECGKVLYCVAYGMDAQKYGNNIKFKNYGTLAIGEECNDKPSDTLMELKSFFDSIGLVYEIPDSMLNKLWSKFMLNVGINQVCAAYGLNYGDVQTEGEYRNKMIAAMEEVLAIGEKMGVPLHYDDITCWLNVIDKLYAESRPSMAQDILNKNKTEVEIFADTVIDLGKEYGIAVPINEELGAIIHEKENSYEL
ncbi:MAG: 2-dehydropantoate 2-reductase [Clostridia bacterium]|nr:2-dehydropantoate 2-reductase [Clostridia bacterium]